MALPPWLPKNPIVLAASAAAAVLGAFFLLRKSDDSPGGAPGTFTSSPTFAVGPSDRVLLLGDSLAVGLGKPMQALADASGIAFKPAGEVSTRIDQWDGGARWDAALGDFAPTVVLVSLGTNDMKMFDPKVQQKSRVDGLIQKIRDAGARSVWIIPPTMPFDDKGVRQMIADAAPDLAIHAEQLAQLPRSEDKIHFTPSGYQMFAQAVWTCLTLQQCDFVNSSLGATQ